MVYEIERMHLVSATDFYVAKMILCEIDLERILNLDLTLINRIWYHRSDLFYTYDIIKVGKQLGDH